MTTANVIANRAARCGAQVSSPASKSHTVQCASVAVIVGIINRCHARRIGAALAVCGSVPSVKVSKRRWWACGLSLVAALAGGVLALVSTAFGFAWGELLYAIPPALSLLAAVALLIRGSFMPPLIATVGHAGIIVALVILGEAALATMFLFQTAVQGTAYAIASRR